MASSTQADTNRPTHRERETDKDYSKRTKGVGKDVKEEEEDD